MRKYISIILILSSLLLSSCSVMTFTDDGLFNGRSVRTESILVIVEQSRYTALHSSLITYQSDLQKAGITSNIIQWDTQTNQSLVEKHTNLRSFIITYAQTNPLNGVFFVGNLPSAWYELVAFNAKETFPTELYYMDLRAIWYDKDGNGIFDAHDPLNPQIFSSRINGTDEEIIHYFSKNHGYRNGSLTLPDKAFIFKDDDWKDTFYGSSFGLSRLYSEITIKQDFQETTQTMYLSELSTGGYEFVNQWIHALPDTLFFDEGGIYNTLDSTTIASSQEPVKAMFYNLYNCSAARYPVTNLSSTYLTKTPYGIATFGSTKVGGAYYSYPFYNALAMGNTWGEAFRVWYASFGYKDDTWFLGMMIQGDPALVLSKEEDTTRYRVIDTTVAPPPDKTTLEEMTKKFENFFNK